MAQELVHASSALNELFPIATADARRLLFEHSPGRGDLKFLGDYSAFDLLIEYIGADGCPGFVAVEVKLTEAMTEPVPDMLRPRYAELAETNALFIDHAAEALRRNPLQQLFREHLLAQSLPDNRLYHEGHFSVIAPTLNYHVWTLSRPTKRIYVSVLRAKFALVPSPSKPSLKRSGFATKCTQTRSTTGTQIGGL
jgi:hypothetical protein